MIFTAAQTKELLKYRDVEYRVDNTLSRNRVWMENKFTAVSHGKVLLMHKTRTHQDDNKRQQIEIAGGLYLTGDFDACLQILHDLSFRLEDVQLSYDPFRDKNLLKDPNKHRLSYAGWRDVLPEELENGLEISTANITNDIWNEIPYEKYVGELGRNYTLEPLLPENHVHPNMVRMDTLKSILAKLLDVRMNQAEFASQIIINPDFTHFIINQDTQKITYITLSEGDNISYVDYLNHRSSL